VNRPFVFGVASAILGLVAGIAYRLAIQASGWCAALFGVTDPSAPCSSAQTWVAFVNVFALVTLTGCLISGIALAPSVRETAGGYVGLGDSFLAIGTIMSLVAIVVLAAFGGYLGIAAGVVAVAMTLWALKQERQVALAVSLLLSIAGLVWALWDSQATAMGISSSLLWTFAAGAYVASLRSGEELEGVTA
jgi:hypothetical protein